MSQQPRNIPGFYYDGEKGKYFRIQPNHRAPSKDAKYTIQAVETERQHDRESRKKRKVEDKKNVQNVTKSKWLSHPVHGLDLSVRLGALLRTGGGVGDDIRKQYTHFLRPNTVSSFGKPGPIFAVERRSKALFTTAAVDGRWDSGREMCVTPISEATKPPKDNTSSSKLADGNNDQSETRYVYDQKDTIPISNAMSATTILPLSSAVVLWTSHQADDSRTRPSNFYVSKQYANDSVPWQNWSDEFGDWGTSVHQLQSAVWDMAATRSVDGVDNSSGPVVLATSHGLKVYNLGEGGRMAAHVKGISESEYMSVSFKDLNVFMAATRQGMVEFADLRVKERIVRLSHECQVSAIRRMRNDNLVLVHGLLGTSVYDLRYNKPVGSVHSPSNSLAHEYLKFDIPQTRAPKRSTMGFDYDEELNIMASAGTDFGSSNRVGLWDCGTGKMIDEGPLAKEQFREPVTCLQMVDLRGNGPSCKSILTMNGGVVDEWHV